MEKVQRLLMDILILKFSNPFYGAMTKNDYKPWLIVVFERAYLVRMIRILGRDSFIERLTKLFIKTKLTKETVK